MCLQGEETWTATELLEQFVVPYKQGSTEISVLSVALCCTAKPAWRRTVCDRNAIVAPLRTVVLGPTEIECWVLNSWMGRICLIYSRATGQGRTAIHFRLGYFFQDSVNIQIWG